MLSRHSIAKDAVNVCSEFQYVKSNPSSSIATINITKSTRTNRDALWQTRGLKKGKRAPNEILLRQSLKRIFPNEEILFNVRNVLNIKQQDGAKSNLEVDASIPRLKFHVEYQDPYHYTPSIHYSNRPLADIQATDAFKKKFLAERGESLLQLPCWWDGTDESLVATIKSMRPDLLQNLNPTCQPVPDTEPYDFLIYDVVPDAGPLMRPVFFTKRFYNQGGIWLGNEKLDGVRCCWNHKRQKLYSRSGQELRFLEELKQHMFDAFLDGEIWFGRGQFNEALKLCKHRTSVVDWPSFRVSVFDIAGASTSHMPYSERYSTLHTIVPNAHPFLFIPSVIQINSEDQRLNFERIITNLGGEGMILTEKDSLYVQGPTSKVLKVKPSLDKEALVVASDSEFLTLQLTDGTRFRTRIPDINPPPRIWDVITFTYNRCVQGSTLPEKPQIHRVRGDVTWSEVVASANEVAPINESSSGGRKDFSARWDRNLDNLKGYFLKFARDNNFDPLIPDNWYNIKSQDIKSLPGATGMLKAFNSGVVNALVASFPEIGFDKALFSSVPHGHWKKIQNVRAWLDQFAQLRRFDPLIAENWYAVSRADISDIKAGRSILDYFKGSYIDVLVAAYPELGLDKSMFYAVPNEHWKDIRNVRTWFDQFAKQRGFDPLLAENWYSITRSDILDKKGGIGIIMQFNKSRIKALVAAYPEISFDEPLFSSVPHGYWKNIRNVRKWFDQFAQERGFDPLVAQNWYAITQADILEKKGGSGMIMQFNRSYIKALVAAYPEIDNAMFSKVSHGHWEDVKNVRKWFDQFAKQKGFDPLVAENWSTITRADISEKKGGATIITQFNKTYIKALVASYPEIEIHESMFSTVRNGFWKDVQNVRKWFDQFATQQGFDPLVAENWYTITRADVLEKKGGASIIKQYGKSYIKALAGSYPEIGLDKLRFSKKRRGRRKAMEP